MKKIPLSCRIRLNVAHNRDDICFRNGDTNFVLLLLWFVYKQWTYKWMNGITCYAMIAWRLYSGRFLRNPAIPLWGLFQIRVACLSHAQWPEGGLPDMKETLLSHASSISLQLCVGDTFTRDGAASRHNAALCNFSIIWVKLLCRYERHHPSNLCGISCDYHN